MENWTPLEWARYYTRQGLVVIPSMDGVPRVDWKAFQTEPPTEQQVEGWFKGESFRKLQIYVVCGRASNVVVVDCDSEPADHFWRELLGADVLDSTARSLSGSGRGHHYWFRLGEEEQGGRAAHRGDMKWDLRATGGGVVVPPSPHRSGGTYVWEVPLEHMLPWSYPEIPGKGNSSVEGESSQSNSLAWLLQNPGEGGRNNWVTSTLGHYAKNLPFEDGFRATAELVWQQVSSLDSDHPYEREEFERTVDSVWGTERQKWEKGDEPTDKTGYLSSGGNQLYTLCREKGGGEQLVRYSNFDIVADSMIEDADGRVTYLVDVTLGLEDGDITKEGIVLPGERLGSNDQLSKWMASHRMVIVSPRGDVGHTISRATRLQMYLESQSPKVKRSAPWMGWYDDPDMGPRYVTEQGIIDASGPISVDKVGLVPDPRKRSAETQWEYGFSRHSEASAALRELMTFHDPAACSVFGSIWALAPIKGAVMNVSSLFPHTAIIAPSEAGKTNGYFDLMLQANGRLSVGGTYTPASLRDDLARHRGGFVWVDDPANIDDLGDLLRAAAGEGVHSRKGGTNWSETIQTHLVAPIVLSAEGLEMLKERAMADRTVELMVPSPVSRRSRYGDAPQWDDIVTFMNTVGHMSRFAGTYVQRAFMWLDSIGGEPGLRQMLLQLRLGSGRQAEKLAMVRVGARCLQFIMDEQWVTVDIDGYPAGGGDPIDVIEIVDAWAHGQLAQLQSGPYLVAVVIPTFLASKGFVPGYRSVPHEPLFLDTDGRLRVNVQALAQWWLQHSRSRSDRDRAQQLGSPKALKAEAQSMEWVSGNPIKGKRYAIVDSSTTDRVLEEAGYSLAEALAHAEENT